MIILKINIYTADNNEDKSSSIEVLHRSDRFNDFDISFIDSADFIDTKIGEQIYLIFNHLLATVTYKTDEFIILQITNLSFDEDQNQSLTRNIIHNMNNIITTINNNAYMLKNFKDYSKDDIKEFSEIIFDSSKIATILSRSYLKYSITRRVHSKIEFDVKEMMDDSFNLISFRLSQNSISTIFKYDEVMPFYNGRKGDIQQAILSILINAIESFETLKIKRDRTVVVNLNHIDGKYLLKIMDNGIGIDKKDLEKVFEQGFTTKKNGNGYGLNFSKYLFQSIGGDLQISSKKNEGTIIKIIF